MMASSARIVFTMLFIWVLLLSSPAESKRNRGAIPHPDKNNPNESAQQQQQATPGSRGRSRGSEEVLESSQEALHVTERRYLKRGLVQDAAAQTDHPRGGLHQSNHHQPLLLRPVQLLLHPQTRAPRGGSLPVLLLLQTQALHHHDLHPQLPRPAAADPEETCAGGQTVPLHLHRAD